MRNTRFTVALLCTVSVLAIAASSYAVPGDACNTPNQLEFCAETIAETIIEQGRGGDWGPIFQEERNEGIQESELEEWVQVLGP